MIRRLARTLTAPMRALPDFVIVGTQKGGTTNLYNLLTGHPNVAPATTKEVHFFDLDFGKGVNWYRSHFPLPARRTAGRIITGEASPYYLFHPHAPGRMARVLPRARLILMLRDPVDRAYSHYQHRVRKGIETLTFEEAIEAEEKRLHGELERMLRDDRYDSFNHQNYSYLSRGVYVDQVSAWSRHFGKDAMLVLKSEDFFERPVEVFERVLDFLELPRWEPEISNAAARRRHRDRYEPMNPATRERLREYFEPHNRRLYEALGRDFGW